MEKELHDMIYVLMLAYNRSDIVDAAILRLRNLTIGKQYLFILCDPGYPLNNSKKDIWNLYMKHESKFADFIYLKISNEGVAQNYNQVRQHFKFKDSDKVICFDPDSCPQNASFFDSMLKVLEDKSVAMCILRRGDFDDIELTGLHEINGIKCFTAYRGHSWPMWAFNGFFLANNEVKQKNKYFGFIEDDFYETATSLGLKCVILADEKDDMIDGTGMGAGGQDGLYLSWQAESGNKMTDLPFEDWLEKKMEIN